MKYTIYFKDEIFVRDSVYEVLSIISEIKYLEKAKKVLSEKNEFSAWSGNNSFIIKKKDN